MNQILCELDKLMVPHISDGHVEKFLKPFSKEEVSKAMFQIGSLKVLGIDGKPTIFYQKLWHIVGDATISQLWLSSIKDIF